MPRQYVGMQDPSETTTCAQNVAPLNIQIKTRDTGVQFVKIVIVELADHKAAKKLKVYKERE